MGKGYNHLSLGEREELSRGLACGDSLRAIARRLNLNGGTISREESRNGPDRNEYRLTGCLSVTVLMLSIPKECIRCESVKK